MLNFCHWRADTGKWKTVRLVSFNFMPKIGLDGWALNFIIIAVVARLMGACMSVFWSQIECHRTESVEAKYVYPLADFVSLLSCWKHWWRDAFGNYQRGTWIRGEKVKMILFFYILFTQGLFSLFYGLTKMSCPGIIFVWFDFSD